MKALLGWFLVACLCAAEIDENAVALHSERARQAQARGDFKTAAEEWQQLVHLLPEVAEASSNLGMMWHFDRQYNDAIKAFLHAIALKPDLVAAHLFLGIDYYLTSRPADAIAQLTKAAALNPSDAIAQKWLGMSYLQVGDYDRAIAVLSAARNLNPNDADLLFSLSRTYTKLLFQSCESIRRRDSDSPFLKLLEGKGTSALPAGSDTEMTQIRSLIESGAGPHELEEALARLRPHLTDTEHLYWYGKCSEALAVKYMDAFLAKSPDSYRIHQLKAEYFLAINDEERAISEYHAALAAKPDAPQLHDDLGNIFMVNHEYQRAVEEYLAELKINPYSVQALERLGQAYVDLHEPDRAKTYLDRAIAINPQSFEALRALGQVYYQRASYHQAETQFFAALAAKPGGDSTVSYQLVQTYRKLGNQAASQKWSQELQRQRAKELAASQVSLVPSPTPSTR